MKKRPPPLPTTLKGCTFSPDWVADHLPEPNTITPGTWRLQRILVDGATYQWESMAGTVFVVLFARVDNQQRRWISLMTSVQVKKNFSRTPTWKELREIKLAFFGDVDAECLIPVLPTSRSTEFAPAVLHLWRCLDGTIMPIWPDLKVDAPAMSERDREIVAQLEGDKHDPVEDRITVEEPS